MNRENLPSTADIPDRPTSIRDEQDPFSLIKFLTGRLKEAVLNIPEEIFLKTEGDLRMSVKPTNADFALRVSFWREFERVLWKGSGAISPASVMAGIVSEQYFYKEFLSNPKKVAFMIRPMQTYNKEMEAILMRATERLWELIEIPIYNSKGRFDSKAAEVLMKAVAQVENRVKGMAVQKSENKRVSVNVNTRTRAVQGIETMAQLDARIKQLEAEVNGDNTTADRKSDSDKVTYDQPVPAESKEEERPVIDVELVRGEGEST